MPIQIKDVSTIAAKWSTRAQAAGSDYTAGVKTTTKDWAALTTAAAGSWGQGVSQAVSDGRFAKGVTKAGTDKWRAAASSKGAQRYPQGVAGGQAAYSAGFAPYAAVLASLNLDPRGPKGSPNNYQLVAQVGTALHNKKIQG